MADGALTTFSDMARPAGRLAWCANLPGGARPTAAPSPAPLLWPAIGVMAGIWASDAVGPVSAGARDALLIAPPLCAAGAWLLRKRRAAAVPLAVLVGISGAALGFWRQQQFTDRPVNHIAHALQDEPILTRLAGRIVSPPIERPPLLLNPFIVYQPTPRTQFVLALDELRTTQPPRSVAGQVRVSVEARQLGLSLGQRVEATGRLFRPSRPRNPGEFDWAGWYRRQGIDAGLTVEGAEHLRLIDERTSVWHGLVNRARATARSLLLEPHADLDADSSVRLLDVMILGQRSAADRELNEAFLRAGGLHFLSVSGFNVAILAGATWFVLRRAGRTTTALAVLATTGLFAVVAEPNAPVLRATAAVWLGVAAHLWRRPFASVNWLASACFILLWNPNDLFSAGFQLSFVQVLGLITIVPPLYDRLCGPGAGRERADDAHELPLFVRRQLERGLVGLFIACACAYVVAQPLVLYHFGRWAPWGLVGSLLLAPLVTLITLLSFATMAVSVLCPPAEPLLSTLLGATTDCLLWCVGLFEHLPGAVLESPPPPFWIVLVTYAAFALGLRLFRARPPHVTPAAALLVAVCLAWLGWIVLPAPGRGDGYTLHVLAAGDGNAALFATPAGDAAVFDIGTDTNSDIGETAARAATALGIRAFDAAFVSHAHVDHFSGLPTLARRKPVRSWLTNAHFASRPGPNSPLDRLTAHLPPALRTPGVLHAGDRFPLGDAEVEVLWPPADFDANDSANDLALVLRLSAGGRTILLPGDIEQSAQEALLDAERAGRLRLRADVLVAPHHGAVRPQVTEDFYAAVSPRAVIVSSRSPQSRLEELLRKTLGPDVRVMRTGSCGAVTVRVDRDGALKIEPSLEAPLGQATNPENSATPLQTTVLRL